MLKSSSFFAFFRNEQKLLVTLQTEMKDGKGTEINRLRYKNYQSWAFMLRILLAWRIKAQGFCES